MIVTFQLTNINTWSPVNSAASAARKAAYDIRTNSDVSRSGKSRMRVYLVIFNSKYKWKRNKTQSGIVMQLLSSSHLGVHSITQKTGKRCKTPQKTMDEQVTWFKNLPDCNGKAVVEYQGVHSSAMLSHANSTHNTMPYKPTQLETVRRMENTAQHCNPHDTSNDILQDDSVSTPNQEQDTLSECATNDSG